MKPVHDEVLINEIVPIYGKNNYRKKRKQKTKYESTNSYQFIAYVAYLFLKEQSVFSGEVKLHIFADL